MLDSTAPSLNRHEEYSLADFELLVEVSQLLTVIDLDHVLAQVIDLTARAVGAASASLFLHHATGREWQRLLTARKLDPQESVRVVQRVIEQGLAGWVVRHREGAIVHDTRTDARWHVFPNDTSEVRSALCLPLLRDDEVLAVLTLVHPEPEHFTDHHLRLLTIVANQASVAIRNAQLFDQMQEQQRQLEATLHAIPDVLLVVDDGGRILLVNDSALALLGEGGREGITGASLDELAQIDPVFAPLAGLLTGGAEDGHSFEAHSSAHQRDFVVTIARWENPSGNRAGHVVVMHDVTTLRDLDKFKSEMLKMASHDLRSPLALIVGYCDLIRLDTPPESPTNDYLDVVTRSTRRMSSLLDDMLRVEEIRTSPAELQRPVDFAELVDRLLDTLHMLADSKLQTVEEDIRLDGLAPITLDPMLIREAMENLATNAVKYTQEGGTLRVESYYDDRRVHFRIQDNGIGIPPEDQERIFEWGYRVKRPLPVDQTIDGRGLGLALVKTVLERHKGQVWVTSQEGVGSTFGFWLPR